MPDLKPRFKLGQEIQYLPGQPGMTARPVWEIYKISIEQQLYRIRMNDGPFKKNKVLLFSDQRKYRVFGVPLEEQPPMFPK